MDENLNHQFFQNRECKYFPCHKGIDEKEFNCLFCYCPLYALGKKCGGNFKYNEKGIKDCSGCLVPHMRENYAYITGRYNEILELVKQNDAK